MDELKIDPEFRDLIPPLTRDELSALESNLKSDGCREHLSVWPQLPKPGTCDCKNPQWKWEQYKDTYSDVPPHRWQCQKCGQCSYDYEKVLIDGHNRRTICKRHNILFKTREINFGSREEAMAWIIRNQFARRNLNPTQRAELALKLEPLIAAKAKDNQKGGQGGILLPQKSAEAIETRKELAKAAGVSHDTISKVKVIMASGNKELADMARRGDVSVNAAAAVVRAPAAEQQRAIKAGPDAVKDLAKKQKQDGKKKLPIGLDQEGCSDIPEEETGWKFHPDVPDKAREAFTTSEHIDKALNLLRAAAAEINLITGDNRETKPLECGLRMNRQILTEALKTLRTQLTTHRPAAICCYCKGRKSNCTACHGRGWTDASHTSAPKELRAAVDGMVKKQEAKAA